ncbi:MAG: hypothetical protein CM1200mP29_10510 [Verrucomicrobiota bacterium]|nr:MAG: hypothetical protein CM1200mP29_10510 [Verrucomicrobiota bacterium]
MTGLARRFDSLRRAIATIEAGRLNSAIILPSPHLRQVSTESGPKGLAPCRSHQPINHDLDRVCFLWIEFEARVGLEFCQLTVDSRPNEPLYAPVFPDVTKLALLFLTTGASSITRVSSGMRELLDDVTRAQTINRLAALRTVRLTDVGKQQPR